MLAPLSVTWIIGSFLSDRLFKKWGMRATIGIGTFISVLGALLLFLFPASTSDIYFYLNSALMGLGFGMAFTITTVAVQEAVPKSQTGISTATNNLFRNVGQTIGVAILGTVFNSVINNQFGQHGAQAVSSENLNKLISPTTASSLAKTLLQPLREILYSGLNMVFLTLLFCCLIAFLLFFLLPKATKKTVAANFAATVFFNLPSRSNFQVLLFHQIECPIIHQITPSQLVRLLSHYGKRGNPLYTGYRRSE